MRYTYLTILFCLATASCNTFGSDISENAIARVGDNYLYQKDIKTIVPKNTSATDSTLITKAYIEKWANNILVMEKAKINLSEKKQQEFKNLIKQYENDLFTKAYLDALVKRSIDTAVSVEQAQKVYNANKESFKLNDELLQLRYLSVRLTALNLEKIKNKFQRFNEDDKRYLDSISVQFNSYSLNDSTWVKASQVIKKIPIITEENKNQLLKKSNFVQLKDSLNLYLMHTKEVLLRNAYAPLDYVKPTVNQIVINRRKLELIKQIQNDITKDAIKNKQFEIYK